MDTSFQSGLPPHPVESAERPSGPVAGQLGLWDAVSIIVGIIIGVGIFRTPSSVFSNASGPWAALAIWGMLKTRNRIES